MGATDSGTSHRSAWPVRLERRAQTLGPQHSMASPTTYTKKKREARALFVVGFVVGDPAGRVGVVDQGGLLPRRPLQAEGPGLDRHRRGQLLAVKGIWMFVGCDAERGACV